MGGQPIGGSFRVSMPHGGAGNKQRQSDPSGAHSAGGSGRSARNGDKLESSTNSLGFAGGDPAPAEDFGRGLGLSGSGSSSFNRRQQESIRSMASTVDEETDDDLMSVRSSMSKSMADSQHRKSSMASGMTDSLPEIPPFRPTAEAADENEEDESDGDSNLSNISGGGVGGVEMRSTGLKNNQVAPDLSPIPSSNAVKERGGAGESNDPPRPTTSYRRSSDSDKTSTVPFVASSAKVEPSKPVDGIVVVKASTSVPEPVKVPTTMPGGGSMEEQLERMRKQVRQS